MSDETDVLRARLAELEGGKKKERERPSIGKAVLGVAGILAVGGVGYLLMTRAPSEPSLATAVPEEFQATGPGFGAMPTFTPEPPIVITQEPPEPAGPSEAELQMLATIEALRSEVEALRNAPADDSAATAAAAAQAQIDALSQQIALLQRTTEEADRARQRELAERDRELLRLQSELDLARLRPPAPATPSPEVDPEWLAEQERLEELRRRRELDEAAREARIRSPMIAFGSTGTGGDENPADRARLSDNDAFVRHGAAVAEVTRAVVIANPSNTVVQGTIIQAVMETAIDSGLPGAVRALVSEDVHSYDGTRVLIPRGSQLIGRYSANVQIGQQRVMIAWDRIILPSNQSVEISSYGADQLGVSGTTGFVDSRFGTRFGSAALISLIGAMPAAAAANIEEQTTRDTVASVGEDLQDVTGSVMSDYLRIPPVIYVDQGSRITVMVDRDLEIF